MNPFSVNASRLDYDVCNGRQEKFEAHLEKRPRRVFAEELFTGERPRWLEIGAGTGWFFIALAQRVEDRSFIAIERSKLRAQRMIRRATKSGLPNLATFRGNAIRAVVHEIPDGSLERIYILYPCPWPKASQRKNRWYLHPLMRHLVRCLQPGGHLIWASDQNFYIEEARYVSEKWYRLETVHGGPLTPNPFNALEFFPNGRTKFEQDFLGQGLPCYELISQRLTGDNSQTRHCEA